MGISAGLVRGLFSAGVLWVYLVFGSAGFKMANGEPPTSAELGIISIVLVLISYIGSGLVIRSIKKEDPEA